MYNENICAFADTMTLDSVTEEIARAPRKGQSATYGIRISAGARNVGSAGAAVGDDLFEDQRRSEEISRILVVLNSSFYEDYGTPLNATSRASFMRFMTLHRDAQIPLLGAESSGRLVATWQSEQGCLSIRFVEIDQLHYAISLRGERGASRTGGEANVTDIFSQPEAKRLATS
jgi:hypothetical protein